MIRNKSKEYGEVNHPDTAVASRELSPNKFIVISSGPNPVIKELDIPPKSMLIIDSNQRVSYFTYGTPNRLIGTDETGELTNFERYALPVVPPPKRELIAELIGDSEPFGILKYMKVDLIAPYYYEVEVIGAGGGGGGSVFIYNSKNEKAVEATIGGEGGYYKGIFSVLKPIDALLQAGCSGGGGGGHSILLKSNTIAIGTNTFGGGEGGRTPILYSGTGGKGGNAIYDDITKRLGGGGVNGGANGGDVDGVGEIGTTSIGSGSAGGGANGPYGGQGGYFIGSAGPKFHGGAGGGAGGGFGIGGDGGDSINGAIIIKGSRGYGGGGGGYGIVTNEDKRLSAGGGGGGGGSRFKCGEIEILCGGGGGGAGGGGGEDTIDNVSTYNGGNGKNNQNEAVGGGNNYGLTSGLKVYEYIERNVVVKTVGMNGGPGIVRLWRCIP